jgi:hypothetical protein
LPETSPHVGFRGNALFEFPNALGIARKQGQQGRHPGEDLQKSGGHLDRT